MMPPRQRLKVSPAIIRGLFNYYIVPAINRGDVAPKIKRDSPADPVRSGQPPGSRSQTIHLLEVATGQIVAKTHCYRLPDGSIGASGKLDPKWIMIGDTEYSVID